MGVLANSGSKTMTSSTDDAVSTGYITGEKISLSTNPTGSTYAWSISRPNGSSAVRAALSDDDAAAPKFTPDVGGLYTLVCTVDGTTTYTLRITVIDAAVLTPTQALRLAPIADSQVTTPPEGVLVLYNSATHGLVVKDDAGDIFPVDLGAAI